MSGSDHELVERLVGTERIFDGRIINLRVDDVALADGRPAKREVVEHPGAVAVVAVLPGPRVVLVRQWRHATGGALLEIPAGTLDAGEAPLECARRELAEETRLAADRLDPVVTFWSAPGFLTEQIHLFLATGLTPAAGETDADEIIHTQRVDWDEALRMCLDGRIQDAKSIAGILACRDRVEALRQEGVL